MTELERQLIETDSQIEKLEVLYTAWESVLPNELSQLIAKDLYRKKAQNALHWAEITPFTQLPLTEDRRVYCPECDRDYEKTVEIGGEIQFLEMERCKYGCETRDLKLFDVDTDGQFDPLLNIFEQ